MLVSKISAFNQNNAIKNQNKINFKGNADNPVSNQKNDPEYYMPPEYYYGALIDSAMKSDAIKDKDFTEEMELLESGSESDIIRSAVNTSVEVLEMTTKAEYERIPQDKLSKIPSFVQYDLEDYLKTFDSLNEQMEQFSSALNENISMFDADDQDTQDALLLASILNEATSEMPDFSMQGKIMRQEKYPELKNIFNMINKVSNYSFQQALNAGFERNPKRAIDILTKNAFIASRPEITDNNDGTSTYMYASFSSVMQIRRDNANGDYISCSMGYGNEQQIEFNADGTIKEIRVQNPYNQNSYTKFIPNAKTKTVQVVNVSDNAQIIRNYKKNENDTYSLVTMQMHQG
ncbi:MAG: hypothetical protein IJ877_02405 [Candidatus Gastranaerophilales bacterium]|nr:hypothetical protein [Candidatus Gastranaerophilales bacterium]